MIDVVDRWEIDHRGEHFDALVWSDGEITFRHVTDMAYHVDFSLLLIWLAERR